MKKYLFLFLFSSLAFAKQFEIFDGQIYNGRFYTLVDIIEWGEQEGKLPHLEFHIHKIVNKRPVQDRLIELGAVAGEKGGKPVLWIMYSLKSPEEKICRHVLAPRQFKEGMKLYAYKDTSDPDYDNIYISSEPKSGKKLSEYKLLPYERCDDENASNKPVEGANGSAAAPAPAAATPASAATGAVKKEGKGVGVDYDNQAMPFSF